MDDAMNDKVDAMVDKMTDAFARLAPVEYTDLNFPVNCVIRFAAKMLSATEYFARMQGLSTDTNAKCIKTYTKYLNLALRDCFSDQEEAFHEAAHKFFQEFFVNAERDIH